MYKAYGLKFGLSIFQVIQQIPLHCNLGNLLTFLPQIYWFILMVKGAIKLIQNHYRQIKEEKKK